MLITKEMLKSKYACKPQYNIFSKEWPNGAIINEDNLKKANKLKLDLYWFMINFLPNKYSTPCIKLLKSLSQSFLHSRNNLWNFLMLNSTVVTEEYKTNEEDLWNDYLDSRGKIIIKAILHYAKKLDSKRKEQ